MKVLLIHGQNHKGSSYHMGRILAEKIANEGEITEFFLPRDLNHFCVGCYSCIDDVTKCPYWQEKKLILDAMEESDVFIFTTPNYCLAPSGAIKSFLDLYFDIWMVHRPQEWMFEKRAVVLSSSAGASCKKALRTVKDSLFYWGVPYIKTYGIAVQAMNWKMVDSKKKEKINNSLSRIASSIENSKSPRVGIKTKFIFNMMRLTHQKGWDSSPVEADYWRKKGWLNKERPWNNN